MIPNINLLPTYEKQSVILYRLFIAGLVILLLAFIGCVYTYFYAKMSITKVDEQYEELVLTEALLEAKSGHEGSSQSGSLASAVKFAEDYATSASMLVEEFVDLLPEGASIQTYNYYQGAVSLESTFETKSDISAYMVRLLTSEFINDLTIDQITSLTPTSDGGSGPQQANYSFDIHIAKMKRGGDIR